MSGLKMMKRTRGIEEFEFLGLREALGKIAENKKKRKDEREKKGKVSTENLKETMNGTVNLPEKADNASSSLGANEILWEMKSNMSEDVLPHPQTDVIIDQWANKISVDEDEDVVSNPVLEPTASAETSIENIYRETNVLITVSGWVAYDIDDHTYPFSTLELGMNGDQYSLIWETKILQELGSTLSILFGEIASFVVQQGLQVTILPILGALTGPMWLMKLTYLVDNPWGNALTKAEKAGRLLADTLIAQIQSNRPVTLVGFSLGARLIFFCLLELASRGAYGVVESVYMFGTPCVANKKEWDKIGSVVSGRIVNGYTTNDMLLGVLYRASISSYKYVPGLSPVQNASFIENVDLTAIVNGHMEYQSQMPKILKEVGFVVNADEFEDQDVETANFKQAQEELKARQKQLKQQEKLTSIKKRQEEKEAELEKKRLAKAQELERLRLSKEAELADKKRKEDQRSLKSLPAAPKLVVGDDLASEELNMMVEMERMMQQYWEPRELPSTLPTLVLNQDPKSTTELFDSKEPESRLTTEDELSDF
jgi:Skp family chaperone for outer membrane proteins